MAFVTFWSDDNSSSSQFDTLRWRTTSNNAAGGALKEDEEMLRVENSKRIEEHFCQIMVYLEFPGMYN